MCTSIILLQIYTSIEQKLSDKTRDESLFWYFKSHPVLGPVLISCMSYNEPQQCQRSSRKVLLLIKAWCFYSKVQYKYEFYSVPSVLFLIWSLLATAHCMPCKRFMPEITAKHFPKHTKALYNFYVLVPSISENSDLKPAWAGRFSSVNVLFYFSQIVASWKLRNIWKPSVGLLCFYFTALHSWDAICCQKKNKPEHKHQWLQLYTSWYHFCCDEAQITEEFRMIALQAELQTENNWQHKIWIMTEQTDPWTEVLSAFRKSQRGEFERICFMSSNETPFSIVWNVILCVWVYLSLCHT